MSEASRKGRHARSRAITAGSEQDHNLAFGRGANAKAAAALLPPSALTGLPAGVDPLTLDPDDAFTQFSVREVQSIETSLQTSCTALTSRLRLLVSERYRDMLVTANTLIDMSASSSNLVDRISSVQTSLHRAENVNQDDTRLTSLLDSQHDANDVRRLADEQEKDTRAKELFAIAATTKLIAEAPDEVWRAIDVALQSADGNDSSSSSVSMHKSQTLRGRELGDYQAATTLRAAWIFTLAEASWKWLTTSCAEISAEEVFPYIVKQQSSLSSMRPYIVNATLMGFSGWTQSRADDTSKGSSEWQDTSTSYLATVTSFVSLALIEGSSLTDARDIFLRRRRETLAARIRESQASLHQGQEHNLLANVIRFVADTMLHALRAFALPEPSSDSSKTHLASVYDRLQSTQGEAAGTAARRFPPGATAVLNTLPSSSTFTQHLPLFVRQYTPTLLREGQDIQHLPEDTSTALQQWTRSIDKDYLTELLPTFVNSLTTIATIGDVQSAVWANLDRCVAETHRVCGSTGKRFANLVERELRSLSQRIDHLLVERLKVICHAYGDSLSSVVVQAMRSAVDQLSKTDALDPSAIDESDAEHFLFESSSLGGAMAADASTATDGLEQKLRIRTHHVQTILNLAEEHAKAFADETKAYARVVRRAELRSARRKRDSPEDPEGAQYSEVRKANSQEILTSCRQSLQDAKMSIARALKEMGDECLERQTMNVAANLFLARLASALCRNTAFALSDDTESGRADNGRPIDDDRYFVKDLQASQHAILHAWSQQVVERSIARFSTRKSATALMEKGEQRLPNSASGALLDALAVLAHGCQAAGMGYRSEAIWLRTTMLQKFCLAYVQVLTPVEEQSRLEQLYDVEVLRLLMGMRSLDQNLPDAQSELVRKAFVQIKSEAQPHTPSTWQTHIDESLPSAISRIRLVLAAVVLDEAILAEAISGGDLERARTGTKVPPNGMAGSSYPSSAPVPPLPMLQLVKPRERIQRIRPAVAATRS